MSGKAWAVAVVVGAGVLLYACTASSSDSADADADAPSCESVYAFVIEQVRSDSTEDVNAEFQFLNDSCPDEYDVLAGYMAGSSTGTFASECADLVGRLPEESIEMLRADGHCISTPALASDTAPTAPVGGLPGAVQWDAADAYVGTTQTVCGPLVSAANVDGSLFFNLGWDYPNPERFQIILWQPGYVDPISTGATVCATGVISIYEGASQIEFSDYWELWSSDWR